MAKSTLARGLADLLGEGPFVTLPLGATEERLVGTLDLDAALGQGRAQFSPGVLAKADGGVLYVDEVNLLADHLVDLLLDVAASGTNVVERDGISHRHPARFVLIGTMNPEEGELAHNGRRFDSRKVHPGFQSGTEDLEAERPTELQFDGPLSHSPSKLK
jgi:magnesium chelatase subunit I